MLSPSRPGLREDHARLQAEINVTPLVDVMLVLLVIFMVTAPMLTAGFAVELPKASAAAELPAEPIVVSLRADGGVAIGEELVARDALTEAVQARAVGDFARAIHLRADREVPYGTLIGVMDDLGGRGFKRVALVVERSRAPATAAHSP